MIRLTRLNGIPFYLNCDLIEHIDATADTVITLTSGPKLLVTETPEEVCEKVFAYRRAVFAGGLLAPAGEAPSARLDVVHG
jgi:flagellar protein FlbD